MSRGAGQELEVVVDPRVCAPWGGLRALVAAAQVAVGEEAVAAGLARARGPLSLLFDLGPLPAEEQVARAEAAVQEHGLLSHNYRTRTPLARAWLTALEAIVPQGTPVRVSLLGLDPDSVRVLRRMDAAGHLRLTLVAGPGFPASGWDLWDREQVLTDTAALGWAAGPGEGRLVSGVVSAAIYTAPELAMLGEGSQPGSAKRVIAAMAAAFAARGFALCLKLGLGLLAEGGASLSRAERARVHRLVALSAYNRQVGREGGGEALARLLDEHLRAALDEERDPLVRAHLCYRLAINAGRRQGEVTGARRFVNRGLRLTERHASWTSNYLSVWLHNAASYLAFAAGDLPEARLLLSLAISRLDLDGAPTGWRIEALQSRAVLLDNAVTLALGADDLEAAEAALDALEAHALLDPDTGSTALRRAALLRRRGELCRADAVLRAVAPREVEVADALDEEAVLVERSVLASQRGRAAEAVRLLRRLLALRERLAQPEDVASAALSLAIAELRAGEDARERLVSCLEGPLGQDAATEAEICGWLARASALRGEGEAADTWANRAIGAAVRSGLRAALARVARVAAETCVLLDRRDAAREAFRRALALAGDAPDLAPERAAAWTGLWELGEVEALEPAAAEMIAALADPDTWWELPRLAPALDLLPEALGRPLARALAARAEP